MATKLKIPVFSIPCAINSTATPGAVLGWYNGTSNVNRSYQWTITLTVTAQSTSSNYTRQKHTFNGQDIDVGMWIGNLSSGLAWQIVSVTSKTTSSVTCVVQDINRYNTYRVSGNTGQAAPATGSYVVFELSEAGLPLIDPIPSTANSLFYSQLVSRFQYFNEQTDYTLNQPGFTSISFNYGDIIAIDEATQTFVEADSSHTATIIGSVTSVDELSTSFTINPISKLLDNFDTLPGQVGSFIYTDLTNPGQLTATSGGAVVYLKIRNNTQTITLSNTFGSTTTVYTSPGNTFYVNEILATVGGTGILLDVVNAINGTTGSSGVTAILSGSGPYYITSTAIDARPVAFADATGGGSTTLDIGLSSAENGIKAAAIVMSSSSSGGIPAGLTASYGFVFVQAIAATTWSITHNAGTTNVSAQIYNNTTGTAASGNIVLPDEITIIDINNIQVTFQAAQSGTALLTILL